MAIHYLITPLDEEDSGKWEVSAELFLEEAAKKWPEGIVHKSDEEVTVAIPADENRRVNLRLLRVGRAKLYQMLSTDTGSHYEAAEPAALFRKLVPIEHKLYLVSGNLSIQLELTVGVTADQIIASVKELIKESWGFAWQAFESYNLDIIVISAGSKSDYSETREKLIKCITQQWPGTESTFLSDPADSRNLYRLKIFNESFNQSITIYLVNRPRCITVSGDPELCSQFALWYRRHVPLDYKIHLTVTSIDQSKTVGISLIGDTTEEEIVEAILGR